MGWFSRRPKEEDELVKQTANVLMMAGMSRAEARDAAETMLAKAKEQVAQQRLSQEPPNRGDSFLEQETTNVETNAAIAALMEEGVTRADIRTWWNQSPLQRIMVELGDEFNRTAAAIAALQQGKSREETVRLVWSIHPRFGNPKDGEGEDRPLPIELKPRIVAFIERYYNRPSEMRRLCESSTSFNALVRQEIAHGRL